MKIKSGALLSGVIAGVSLFLTAASTPVHAGGGVYKGKVDETRYQGPWSYAIYGIVTSDYRYRGFSQSDGDPALQGGFEARHGMFYGGIFASTVDYRDGFDDTFAHTEVDFYGGIRPQYNSVTFDFGVNYSIYPGADDDTSGPFAIGEQDYVEFNAGAKRNFGSGFTLGGMIYYSPDYSGELGSNWVYELNAEKKFARGGWRGLHPRLLGSVGWSDGDEGDGGFDYGYWKIGLAAIFATYFEAKIEYVDTFDVPVNSPTIGGSCSNLCDDAVVGTLAVEF